jgi:hypothetical protein
MLRRGEEKKSGGPKGSDGDEEPEIQSDNEMDDVDYYTKEVGQAPDPSLNFENFFFD